MTALRCRFPAESCDAPSVSWLVNTRTGQRLPICRHHRAKARAHVVAMKQGVAQPNGPMHPRVIEARSMLNAHTLSCQRCAPVVDALMNRLAALDEAPTEEQNLSLGEYITVNACKIGVRLYFSLGAAMKALAPAEVERIAPRLDS